MPFVSQSTTIECGLNTLKDMFEGEGTDWMVPFIRLASSEGRAEAARMRARFGRAQATPDTRTPDAKAEAGPRALRMEPPGFVVDVRWTTAGYGQVLSAFKGRIVAVPLSTEDTMVSLEGDFAPETSRDFNARLAERRSAEATLRSLLRLLRSAVEEAEQVVR